MEPISLQVSNEDPDIARASDKFFPNKGRWEMAESTGSGTEQTGVGIPN